MVNPKKLVPPWFRGEEDAPGCAALVPPRIIPLLKKRAYVLGEGIWTADQVPLAGVAGVIFKTWLRVDAGRPYSVLYLVSMELSEVDVHLVAGTEEPISSTGIRGKGRVPDDPQTVRDLVLIFNGGFRTKHGKWGFIADRVTYLPPVAGIATVAVDGLGQLRMGTWGKNLPEDIEYVHLRQNLPPLVEDGRLNRKHSHWGFTIKDRTHVWRSALGITKDGKRMIYGAGNSLTHETLGAGMIRAGCDYAMQLDVNPYHTYLNFCNKVRDKKGSLRVSPEKLAPQMAADVMIGVKPYTRDLFYVTWRKP